MVGCSTDDTILRAGVTSCLECGSVACERTMAYPPEVAELLDRGAEVVWLPIVGEDGEIAGAVIIGVAWPLWWDVPYFRNLATGRDGWRPRSPRRCDGCIAVLSRAGPALSPVTPNAP